MTTPVNEPRPFRFFDNREKYLLFVTTCTEKQVTAARIGREINHIQPRPPALRVFDAGMGDGTILSMVLRDLHHRWPTVPFFIVGKEISAEDVRLCLDKLADRFHEHPQMVVVFTNLFYTEAPWLIPGKPERASEMNWREVALTGSSAHEFDAQIKAQIDFVNRGWQTTPSPQTGNPLYVTPSALVFYRADHRFILDDVIPRCGQRDHAYDLVSVSQPYRARSTAEAKVRNVLAPLAQSLAPGGRMIVIQSTGRDPGMEIIRAVWPGEDPFRTPRNALIEALRTRLDASDPDLDYDADTEAEFRYHLQIAPQEVASNIGTSALLAAWNAAIYVAQIEDDRLTEAMSHGTYLDATRDVLERQQGLWFNNECFVVTRRDRA
ncbi:MAG: hypothetical protein O7G83_01220 [Proteobacteria bacterium]|nr:hypothetical protein [Pseudomonadota bacterium]